MSRKLPADAFEYYVALGENRSHAAVATHFGVSKRCVTKRASQESWSERLARITTDARVITDKKLTETVAEMHERHMKLVRLMAGRALEGLRNFPITSGMEAIRAGDIAVKLERLLAGEVSERGELSIEDLHRNEIRALLEVVPAAKDSAARTGALQATG